MPRSTVQEDSPYPIPEDTLAPLELLKCEQVEVPFTRKSGDKAGQASSFTKWEWTFRVYDGEYAGTEIRGSSEPKVTNASEASFLPLARPIVEALLARSLDLGEDVDTDMLIGLKAQGSVKHLPPRPRKNGDGHWFNVELAEIYPAHPTNGTAPAVPPTQPQQAAWPTPQPAQDAWGTSPSAPAPAFADQPPY